ncbi:hypothetical protein [Sulfurimonas paralvinellae]|uniref:YfiR family protein n=1 Tax=Sulfurimonas paralvinellae TaxID=317658 RepID=A0A7M1B5M8_9BACT|nr:hypothetical protein [Sulfurimonas paralvinellae]QOP44816.1 hypothetical protein FM071_00265 [Sulfurimonas paralvinellae]
MKQFLIFFILFSELLLANNLNYEMKIYDTIFHALFPTKKRVKVWSDNTEKLQQLAKLAIISPVKQQKNADILLLTNLSDIQNETPKFVCDYKLLKNYRTSAIGGFYWQKGRPNIIFLEKNLKKFHIKLPASMQEYIEE